MSVFFALSAGVLTMVLWICGASAQSAPLRVGLVIGNNRSADAQRQSLRYADDDAAATHLLLAEADVENILLVDPDADTRAFYRAVRHEPPTADALRRSVAYLAEKVAMAKGQGAVTEFLLFYSGHGDVEGGEGYVQLEGSRLTRSGLFSLLQAVGADRSHVVIDACKSYFLVFERGPGGRRTKYAGPAVPEMIPANLPNTGFILSTSSDRDSHEWERFHGGIVSHELRSALRGGADVDGNRRLTYAEVGAFLTKANERIIARYRPDVMVRAPGGEVGEDLFYWTSPPTLELTHWQGGHLYVESARAERLIDLHQPMGSSATLWTPAERPIFLRHHDESLEYKLVVPGAVRLDSTPGQTPPLAAKGGLNVIFEQLFAMPFSPEDVARFEVAKGEASTAAPAVLASDGRASTVDGGASRERSRRKWAWAYAVAGIGLGALGMGAAMIGRAVVLNEQSKRATERALATHPVDAAQRDAALDRYDDAVSLRRSGLIVGAAGVLGVAAAIWTAYGRTRPAGASSAR